jgi:uncharacterized protein YjbJ (UPF0337 family)
MPHGWFCRQSGGRSAAMEEGAMTTWNEIKTNWTTFEPKIRNRWSKLTNEDLKAVHGDQTRLMEKLETRYHFTEPVAKKEIAEFLKTQPNPSVRK